MNGVMVHFLPGFFYLYGFMPRLCKKIYKKYVFHSKVKRLPTFCHEEGSLAVDASTCVVCLENFEGGELCKLLPTCGHVFRIACNGAWLKK